MSNQTDGQLYIRFLHNGDEAAFRTLFEKHRGGLTLFLYGMVGNEDDAEELMMDTFAVLASGTAHYSIRRNAEFKTWLYAVARNQARTFLRRNKQSLNMVDELDEERTAELADDISSQPEDVLLQEENSKELWQALNTLSPDYRQVLYLTFFEELQPEEISKVMKKSVKQIYNLTTRAKSTLKKLLEDQGFNWTLGDQNDSYFNH